MQSKKRRYIFYIISLLLIGFIIYWFTIRPANINKHCSRVAAEYAEKMRTSDRNEAYMVGFEACKHNRGL